MTPDDIQPPDEQSNSRRDALRWGAFGVLGAVAGTLLVQRLPRRPARACGQTDPCRQCPILADCHLPEARAQRRKAPRS